jgi:hypothetical protein
MTHLSSAGPPPPPAGLWEPELWDELLDYVEERRVVPIVGPDLLQMETPEGLVPLDRYLARELGLRLGLGVEAPDPPTLNAVVCAHLDRGQRREALYPKLKSIMQEARFAPPAPLRQLAEIAHFDLYVTTTFDTLLEDALNQARFDGQGRTASIAYSTKEVMDLESPKDSLAVPVVYHLFGRLSASPSYVLSDEDLLEFMCALQSPAKCPERLFDELERNHLLVIGENFADWLTRLFLRTTKGQRLSEGREVLEILADSRTPREAHLVAFLRHFSSRTRVYQGGAVEFVDELHRRYRARFPQGLARASARGAPPREMQPDAVFISYASEDRPAVERLKAGLESLGLPVWFDKDKLQAGDEWRSKIRANVERCGLFLPVLSRTTEARVEGEFRREWRWAVDREQKMAADRPFILPLVVDDTARFERVEPRFASLHIASLPGGDVTPEFGRYVVAEYAKMRRAQAAGSR